MKTQDLAILKSLVSVAWADGEYHDSEREMVEALISAFEAKEHEAQFIREYASEKRTLEDIPLDDLSVEDRRLLLQHAVYLTFVDKEQHAAEKTFLDALAKHLALGEDEAREIRAGAEQRALAHMSML